MAAVRVAGERGHRLALAAGHQHQQLRQRDRVDLLQGDRHPGRDAKVAELLGRLHIGLQAAPGDPHPPPVLLGQRDHLLDAVQVGGEAGDHDPGGRLPEDALEGLEEVTLGPAVAFPLGVGRVAEQQQHPVPAELSEPGEVGGAAFGRVVVELEVPGVDHHPHRRLDGQRGGVRDAVADGDHLHAEGPEPEAVADPDLPEVGLAEDAVLLQLGLGQPEGQARAVDGHVEALEDEGKRADVVLVTVGEHDAQHLLAGLEEVGDVGDDEVDAVHLQLREHQPGVHDQELVLPLQRPHVPADLAEPAQGDVAKLQMSLSCSGSAGGGGGSGGGGARTSFRYAFTFRKSAWRSSTRLPLWSAAAG